MGSLIPSSRREKTKEPDFGTYLHSTSVASKKVRIVVKAMFTDAFASIPFGRDDELRILDVGCGLGYLSCLSAEFYQTARITGIDTFEHASLKRSVLRRLKKFRKFLASRTGLISRRFISAEKFDIIVSNLVSHNFGKKRFKAYSLLSSWTQAGAFVIMGDLFFSPRPK